MNVYDFDNTIYDGDSTVDFYIFCLKRRKVIALQIPLVCIAFIRYKLERITKTRFKEIFYRFLKDIDDIDLYLAEFWNLHIKNIKPWYLKMKKEDDVLISASPFFLIQVAANILKIKYVIASNVNKHNGRTSGENCYNIEKVKRFQEVFFESIPDNFYSDSLSDAPMAKISTKAFLVKGDEFYEWPSRKS